MDLNRVNCEIHRNLVQRLKEGPPQMFDEWKFLDINGNFVKGSELMGLDGCDIRRKLGWADLSCTCPEYNQRFLLVDEDTDDPLPDIFYQIKSPSGEIVTGKTDGKGFTEKIHAKHEEEVEITVYAKIE